MCGVVLEFKGERLQVLAQTSREMTLAPKRVLHAGPRLPLAALSRQELLRHLEETARKREALKAAIDLDEVWELLAQENQAMTGGRDGRPLVRPTTPDQVAATGRRLREDRFLFKQKEGLVIPNPPELVEQLQGAAFQRELERQPGVG